MDINEKPVEDNESRIEALRRETKELEEQVASLKEEAKSVRDSLENNLIRQIEVLTIFCVMIALIITNVIGIDALGTLGMRGLAKIDISFVVSALLIMIGVKFLLIGFKKN